MTRMSATGCVMTQHLSSLHILVPEITHSKQIGNRNQTIKFIFYFVAGVTCTFLPCNEDVFPDSSGPSSCHCSCVFIGKVLLSSFPFSRRQNLSSTQEPRPCFSASAAFNPAKEKFTQIWAYLQKV